MRILRRLSFLLALAVAPAPATALQDIADLNAMLQALNDALDIGRPGITLVYQSVPTGNRGTVTAAAPAGQLYGDPCWSYERTYGPPGQEFTVGGRACRAGDGLWQIVEEGDPRLSTAAVQPAPSQPAAPAGPPPLRDRAVVAEIQQHLSSLGYDPGPADGVYGPRTGNAIATYQNDESTVVDGEPSIALLEALRADVAARPPSDLPWQTPPSQPATATPAQPTTDEPPSQPVTTTPAQPAPDPQVAAAGTVAIASLSSNGNAYVGQTIRATGTYLHFTGSLGKLHESDDTTSAFAYVVLDQLSDAERKALRNDCFLCTVTVQGPVESRELYFAGASLGKEPAIVVHSVER